MTERPTTGHIEVYDIGEGWAVWMRRLRMHVAGVAPREMVRRRRTTTDRWHRRWQAEHTGELDRLGAARGWTRTGAYIAMHRRIEREMKKRGNR